MPPANVLAAIDTLLAAFVTFVFGGYVGYMRGKWKILAPATAGHPDFERAFRIHSNTVENLVLFIPLLWVASAFYGGTIPFWLGVAWVISRLVYAWGYSRQNTQLRGPGALLGFVSLLGLLVLSAIGLATQP
ncbi:MAG TPA: MAPEG family protein [Micropepsaceae bacterium]|nr:MAPEG family protein [Micropepsaceae bacterium]